MQLHWNKQSPKRRCRPRLKSCRTLLIAHQTEKSALAGAAGAAVAIIFNDEPGPIGGGTLGPPSRPEGEYIPIVGISQQAGQNIVDSLDAGDTVTGVVDVYSDIRNVTTYNVIAETKYGDHDSVLVLGAHPDSVFDGPGINDDGSGTIGILTTAI